MAGLVTVVGILLVGLVVMLIHPLDRYHRAKCGATLKLLGNAIRTYQSDHQGRLPRELAVLSNELSNPVLLRCPGSRRTPGCFTNADSWADYVLVNWPAVLGTDAVPGDYPIAYDRSMSNHAGRGVNVLSVDGLVRWDARAKRLKKFAAEHPDAKLPMPE